MSSILRPITPADHADVLALNERNVELLAPLDAERLGRIIEVADRASVITHDDAFAGFVITLSSGRDYESTNYAWFTERLGDFYYLDRVVLHPDFRRLGLGSRAYDEVEARGRELTDRLALEVNIEPPNEASLAFHRNRGYREVGQQVVNSHRVSLMVKDLAAG